MLDKAGAEVGQCDRDSSESQRLTDDERRLLTLYRAMSESDRRYIRRVVEVLTAAFI